MSESEGKPALRASREATLAALIKHFSADRLSVSEYERRLDVAHRARTREELDALLRDLPGHRPVAAGKKEAKPTRRREGRPPSKGSSSDSAFLFAVMGGSERKGQWQPPDTIHAFAFWGGVELDFRHAVLEHDVYTIDAWAIMGGVEITVPPDVRVDTGGIALLGGFTHESQAESASDPRVPLIRVGGLALMGGVEVKVKEPEWDRLPRSRKARLLEYRRRELNGE